MMLLISILISLILLGHAGTEANADAHECIRQIVDEILQSRFDPALAKFKQQCGANDTSRQKSETMISSVVERLYNLDQNNIEVFDAILEFLRRTTETSIDDQGIGLLHLFKLMEMHHQIFGDHSGKIFALSSFLKSQIKEFTGNNITMTSSKMPYHHSLYLQLPIAVKTVIFEMRVGFYSYAINKNTPVYMYANSQFHSKDKRFVKWNTQHWGGYGSYHIEGGHRIGTYRLRNHHYRECIYYSVAKENNDNGHVLGWVPKDDIDNEDWRLVAESNEAISIWSDCNHECEVSDNKPIYPYNSNYEHIVYYLPALHKGIDILWYPFVVT